MHDSATAANQQPKVVVSKQTRSSSAKILKRLSLKREEKNAKGCLLGADLSKQNSPGF